MKSVSLFLLLSFLLPIAANAANEKDAAMSLKLFQVLTTSGAFAAECKVAEGAEKAAYVSGIEIVTEVTAMAVSDARPEMTKADAESELAALTKAIRKKVKASVKSDGCESELAKSMITRYHDLLKQDFSTLQSNNA